MMLCTEEKLSLGSRIGMQGSLNDLSFRSSMLGLTSLNVSLYRLPLFRYDSLSIKLSMSTPWVGSVAVDSCLFYS